MLARTAPSRQHCQLAQAHLFAIVQIHVFLLVALPADVIAPLLIPPAQDYVGLDICLSILDGWVQKYPDEPSFVVPKCLREKVAAGKLGRKSGEGFYLWNGDKRTTVAP